MKELEAIKYFTQSVERKFENLKKHVYRNQNSQTAMTALP